MSCCVIWLKIIILIALIHVLNSDNLIKSFDMEDNIIYDEEKTAGTEEYKHTRTETSYDIMEITTDDNDRQTTTDTDKIVTDENNIKVVCPSFKRSGEINLEHFVGVWQPAYYQVSHKVPCFKMLVKKVTSEEKSRYYQTYGDFNEKIIWEDCNLEIKSSANLVHRKHFLQGCEKGFGVLENIIIEQKGDAAPVLIEEDADQWLSIKNMLMMKDCISGEIVIFTREASQPKLNEVLDSMKEFGNISNGEWACNDGVKTEKPQAFNGEFESENDVVFFE